MSIPRPDPNFTYQQLKQAAAEFLDAGLRYWEAMHKAGMNVGAVIWVEDTDGRFVVFTRGEYRDTLMQNIHAVGRPVYQFGAAGLEE